MNKRVLITGGAGFIGSHVADELLAHGYSVRALDSLAPQVHGEGAGRPEHLAPAVELLVGDVRHPEDVRRALEGVDAVIHLAAEVGVGQSMYEIVRYTGTNVVGTATLLEALARQPVERLVVASSMSVYGEGAYRTSDGREAQPAERPLARLEAHDWEVHDADGSVLIPVPTPETKVPRLASVYALTKYDQECLCLVVGGAYGIPTVALRLFNVYGPRQALSNPYTGVLAIFAARVLSDRPPLIFEDGLQQRDFVSVHDVARAFRLALEADGAAGQVLNVGSGRHYTVRQVAELVAEALGRPHLRPEITGKYRVGDIRHCFADITRAREVLGYEPRLHLEDALDDLARWLRGRAVHDRVAEAYRELESHRLAI